MTDDRLPTGDDRLPTFEEMKKMIHNLSHELVRVRTKGRAAAHQLDNLAIEFGFGAGLPPFEIATKIRELVKSKL